MHHMKVRPPSQDCNVKNYKVMYQCDYKVRKHPSSTTLKWNIKFLLYAGDLVGKKDG